jgi:hypothetical protein
MAKDRTVDRCMHEIARKLEYVRPSHVSAPFLNRTQHRRLRKSLQGFKFPSEFVMHIHKSACEIVGTSVLQACAKSSCGATFSANFFDLPFELKTCCCTFPSVNTFATTCFEGGINNVFETTDGFGP